MTIPSFFAAHLFVFQTAQSSHARLPFDFSTYNKPTKNHETRNHHHTDRPETVFNALRLAQYSLRQGDSVRIFLSGRGVEMDQIQDAKFDVKVIAQELLGAGAEFLARGTCLKLRHSDGSEICPLSTLKDHYEIIRDSDRVVTV